MVGVTSESQFREAWGSLAQARLVMAVTPAGSGLEIRTAKSRREAAEPPAREPRLTVQVEPAAGPGEQDQPGEELSTTNVVWSGTTSVRVTDEAVWLPTFETERR